MFSIVPRSLVLAGFALVLAHKWSITSRVRQSPWPILDALAGTMDEIARRAGSDQLLGIYEQLEALVDKVQRLSKKIAFSKNRKYMGLVRSINSADAAERECIIKIIGIPGLSTYYYMQVLTQLAALIGVPFKQSDVIMLKRLNTQPNFVDAPELALSNISYPLFVKFKSPNSKQRFLDRWASTLVDRNDTNHVNRYFGQILSVNNLGNTEKIQILGFRTMSVAEQYKHLDRLCKIIGFNYWKNHVGTIYQSRYTKYLAPDGLEQLQTEGIIVKLCSRALKLQWMRHTRLQMLSRPKDSRKGGYTIFLPGHVKYKDRNFTAYVDEHLSTHKKNLFLIARARCNVRGWTRCWTWDGNVYVKKTGTALTHRINTFDDIDNIIV